MNMTMLVAKLNKASVLILVALIVTGTSAHSQVNNSISVAIPKNGKGIKKPAGDVVVNGAVIDPGQLARMIEGGLDSSQYNPIDNKIWQNKSHPASDAGTRAYPKADPGVQLVSWEGSNPDTSNVFFRVKNADGQQYRLGISRFSQSTMMRAALLRKLGYFVVSPQHYSKLKVNFASKEEKTDFIVTIESEMGVDLK
ncbi:MAG: hypothetical protein V4736_06850, partial [Bdellovibrionota bacterium]